MRTLLIILAATLIGCANNAPAPEVNYYLLRSDGPVTTGSASIGLGTVNVATYIDRPGLVLELKPGVMRPAVYHQWAEPLRESLRGYLADGLSQRLQQPVRHQGYGGNAWKADMDTLVHVHISELHGTMSGAARISASWIVTTSDASEEHSFEQQTLLGTAGYAALLDAEKDLLDALAQVIADSI